MLCPYKLWGWWFKYKECPSYDALHHELLKLQIVDPLDTPEYWNNQRKFMENQLRFAVDDWWDELDNDY